MMNQGSPTPESHSATAGAPRAAAGFSPQARVRQAWTIARIELRRAFFSRRALWVYGLALLPAVIFFGHGIDIKLRRDRLSAHGLTQPALIDSAQKGESLEEVRNRLGQPAGDYEWDRRRRIRARGHTGVTTHVMEAPVPARFVRLNITRPTYSGEPAARIYEFEIYGENAPANLALRRPATGSLPCSENQGPEKAFNGSVSGGDDDKWCTYARDRFLQVDLGDVHPVKRFVVSHASAGGESEESDTREFNIQVSREGKIFTTVVSSTGAGFEVERTDYRRLVYFDGRREARLLFADGKLESTNIRMLRNFEEDRQVFAGIFQFFYLRLAIFFGCLGIFMNLFRGEMRNRTLHFWFLAPARREVLLAGKYGAGLIASAVIFAGGALLCFAAMLWPHDPVEAGAYWQSAGMGHAFWYAAAAALGCVGYGSVFLAVGLLVRNPILPAAVLLGWEGINGILPHLLQKMSVLYYLQSLCPVPVPMDKSAPAIIQLLASPAAPATRLAAITGLLLLTAAVLWIASLAVRRMQISYGTES